MNDIGRVIKAQQGDGKAFAELISSYQSKFYKIAFAYTKNEQDALDIVSDTIYKTFMDINKLKNPEYFYTWATKILINLSINKLRVKERIVFVEEYEDIHVIDSYTSSIDLDIPRNVDLYNAIDKLDLKSKNFIILKYLDDMSIAQISDILNVPQGTVKASIHRALKKLKYELKEECI